MRHHLTFKQPQYMDTQNSVKGSIFQSPPNLQSITMIAAISDEKFLGYQLIQGSVNARTFGTFLLSLLDQYPDIIKNRQKYILFLDNARIHSGKILKPLLSRFNVQFNAPYNPFLNAIEYVFGLMKFYFRRISNKNKDSFHRDIGLSAKKIQSKHIKSFTRHTYSYYFNCIALKDIE